MPQASEAMDHLSGPVQNHPLDLVLTAVWAPIARLQKKKKERMLFLMNPSFFGVWCLSERLLLLLPLVSGVALVSPWQMWSCTCRRHSPCSWWPPRRSAPTSAAGSARCGCTSLPCSTRSGLHTYTETMLCLYFSNFYLDVETKKTFTVTEEKPLSFNVTGH